MIHLIKRHKRFIYVVLFILLSWVAYKIYNDHFSYGNYAPELRIRFTELLKKSNRLAVMKELQKTYEAAKIKNDKKLYIDCYIQYYYSCASFGFKQKANEAFFYLLETEANYLEPDQLFTIYSVILSASLDPYYFRGKIEIRLKESIFEEMNNIIENEKDHDKKYYYLCGLYGMNINRSANETKAIEGEIFRYAPDSIAAHRVINYKKALKYRAKRQFGEELHYMKLASVSGEPGVGELGVSYRNNNMLDSAEVWLLKSYHPANEFKMEYYFFPCINLSNLYIKMQNYEKANFFLKQAEDFCTLYLGEFYQSEILDIKTKLYQAQNMNSLAIEALNKEREHIINQFSTFYLHNKSRTFVINEVRSIRNSRNYLILLFIIVVVGIVSFFILYIYDLLNKYRITQHERETEKNKSQELKQELNHAFNQFSELSHISEKKDKVIESIMSNKDIKKVLTQKDIIHLNDLKKFTNTGNEWSLVKDNFHIHFPEFYSKLLKLNPSLSELELRYATYIKMGLSNAEIATLLNINVQSVATFKYRLKQRLDLDKEQSLLEFIINF